MGETYVVQQGDCLSSIAHRFGFFDYRTIWNHADNAALKDKRVDPNMLSPGDLVAIPDKAQKKSSCATGDVHTFKVKIPKVKVRLAVKAKYELAYELVVNDQVLSGTTDGSSPIEQEIPRDAKSGVLFAWPSTMPENDRTRDNATVWRLALGALDPHDEVSGAQGRLRNLGLYHGPTDGNLDARTQGALRAFQKKNGLDESGQLDDATKSALKGAHGS